MKETPEKLLEKAARLRQQIKWARNPFAKAGLRNRAEELRAAAKKKVGAA